MSRGAWIPMRTFSPMIASTETSMSSLIMMLWLDLRVRTNIGSCASLLGSVGSRQAWASPSRSSSGPPRLSIRACKREQALEPGSEAEGVGAASDYDDEIDLRAEDDALIAAELDAAQAERSEDEEEDDEAEEADGEPRGRRRRGRRGGRSGRTRRRASGPLEATFDHGDEGYGLWLDPAVADDPIYAEYWAGHRPVEVAIEEDQIVIRRAGTEESDESDEGDN